MTDAQMKDVYGIVRPVSRGLVHSWMKKAECVFDRATQTYYTDGNNKPEVIADRLLYLAKLRALSLRMPVWIHMPLSELTPDMISAIKHDGLPSKVHEYERHGKAFIEFHVDRLGCKGEADRARGVKVEHEQTNEDAFEVVRRLFLDGGSKSVRFEADTQCRVGHEKGACKCHLPAWHMGQDECIIKAYLREGKE